MSHRGLNITSRKNRRGAKPLKLWRFSAVSISFSTFEKEAF